MNLPPDLFAYYNVELEGTANTPLEMVREFAKAMGQPLDQRFLTAKFAEEVSNEDCQVFDQLDMLRTRLIEEEVYEFMGARSPEETLKELADIVYVVYGYAATFGWDLDEAVRRVHKSNMSKLGDDGKPIYRADGKVTKGPNYKKPDLGDLV